MRVMTRGDSSYMWALRGDLTRRELWLIIEMNKTTRVRQICGIIEIDGNLVEGTNCGGVRGDQPGEGV